MYPGESDRLPQKCLQANDAGELPTCTQTGDGGWVATYPDSGTGDGAGGAFAALFVLVLVAGVIGTIWKVGTARRMARDAGMDEGDATAMTLLTDDGFEATYLASNLRPPQPATTTSDAGAPARSAAERLRELDSLREQGLVTEEEYAAARRAILDGL